jgi:ribonuclease P protein component
MEKAQRGNKLPKTFRLSGQVATDRLFAFGKSLKAWPFKIIYLQTPAKGKTALPKMLVSVPKRQFKHATDRNRIRRQAKEMYRLNVRPLLLDAVIASGQDLQMAFLYTGGKTKVSPQELEKKLSTALKRLANEISQPKEDSTDLAT